MAPDLYRIPLDGPGRLAISARPRGHDWLADEVAGWQRAGVGLVVSLLEPDEEKELGLTDEAAECAARGIRFAALPVPDRGVPANPAAVAAVVSDVLATLAGGGGVATHCRQGIGRSAVFVAVVLKSLGLTTDEAIRRVSAARGRPTPETAEQAGWIARYAGPPLAAASG